MLKTILIAVPLIVFLSALILFFLACYFAPMGYENLDGFHYGEEENLEKKS